MFIKFETVGCPSCKKLNALLDKVGITPDKTIVIDETNVDIARKFNVCTFPTMLFTTDFEDGDEYQEFDRVEGLPTKSRLADFLRLDEEELEALNR